MIIPLSTLRADLLMKVIESGPIINLQLHELFQNVYVCAMNTQFKK